MKKRTEKLKKMKIFYTGFVALAAILLMPSCADFENDINGFVINQNGVDGFGSPNAIVTVKTSASGKTYFQLDDKTTLEPVGWKNTFGGECRAMVNYSELMLSSVSFCDKQVRVNSIDSVSTRDAELRKVDLKGSDPVEMVSNYGVLDWLTVCEDGYMTVHFVILYGGKKHSIKLYADPKDPDHLYLFHDASKDIGKEARDAVASFRIDKVVPAEKYQTVTLHWLSYEGEKEMKFKYGPRPEYK